MAPAKTLLLAWAATGLITSAAYAEERPAQTPAAETAAESAQPADKAQSPSHESSHAAAGLCSRDNPYNEYRDCVNASTRDPNAKVRLA